MTKIAQGPGIAVNSSSQPMQQRSSLQQRQDPYSNIAKQMEKEYAKMMLEEMRRTIPKSDDNSSELEFYLSYLDDEYADQIAAQNEGKGFQREVLRQIHPEQFQFPKNNNTHPMNAAKKYQQQGEDMQNAPALTAKNHGNG